jgi:phosphate transport system substrate-binding protein
MQLSLRSRLLGGAAVLAVSAMLAGAAQAQVVGGTDNFNGGGSSLAGPTYITIGGAYAGPAPTFNLTYGVSGSGAGASSFISNSLCQNYTIGCPGGTDDFGASDAFLSGSQITAWNAATPGSSGVPIIQIPMFATPITIAYNLTGTSFATDGALELTDNDLGLIFTGQVVNFNDPRLSQNANGVVLPNQAITVIYRSDGSGTSNIFTTHLANVLNNGTFGHFGTANFAQGAPYPQVTANSVVPALPGTGTNTFSTVFTSNGASVPANFTGASGSGGVQAAIQATVGTIGYLSPDYTDIAPANGGVGPTVAAVALNPTGGAAPAYVLPTPTAVKTALGSAALPATQAQLQNQQNFSPLVPVPTAAGSYPIAGYTYWFLSQCYLSQTQTNDIRTFLTAYFGQAAYGSLVSSAGFSPLSSNSGLGKTITTYIAKTNAANVDIGNVNVCGTPVGGVYPKGR